MITNWYFKSYNRISPLVSGKSRNRCGFFLKERIAVIKFKLRKEVEAWENFLVPVTFVILLSFGAIAYAAGDQEEGLAVKNWKGEYVGSVRHVLTDSSQWKYRLYYPFSWRRGKEGDCRPCEILFLLWLWKWISYSERQQRDLGWRARVSRLRSERSRLCGKGLPVLLCRAILEGRNNRRGKEILK